MQSDRASWEATKKFYLKVFTAIDDDVDGYLSDKEFKKFLISCDIQMSKDAFNEIFNRCNVESRGKLKGKFLFQDFVAFMEEYRQKFREDQFNRMSLYVTPASPGPISPNEAEIDNLFNEIDVDKSGTISFREIMVFCKNKGIRLGYGEILAFMKYFDQDGDGELKIDEIKKKIEKDQEHLVPGMAYVPDAPSLCQVLPSFAPKKKREKERKIQKNFADVRQSMLTLLKPKFENELDPDDIENLRWATFVGFNRKVGDDCVMTGTGQIVKDILPGNYNLQDMVRFSDLPTLKPKYNEVKNIKWQSGSGKETGKLIFPPNFDGILEVEFATNELLSYYGCSIANTRKDDNVVVDMRHAIQDFTYNDNYLEKFVMAQKSQKGNGGAGMEHHDFHHLDCPLDVDNGYFVLGKYPDDDDETIFHLTAFRIPVRHTLFLPGGVMHTNDYLKGTWRTMLSDMAPIDYVHLSRNGQNFHFNFKKFA